MLDRSLQARRVDSAAKSANGAGPKIVPALRHGSEPTVNIPRPAINGVDMTRAILPEDFFLGMLCLERRRTERSRRSFLLLLLDAEEARKSKRGTEILTGVVRAAHAARRDTDPAGWYKQNLVLGIIFTELGTLGDTSTVNKLLEKVHDSLALQLDAEDLQRVHVSMHIFPDDSDGRGANPVVNPIFYPDMLGVNRTKKTSQLLKRAMDIIGSAAALVLISPLLLLIAAAIKLNSSGPVLFQQERLGRFGTSFKCLKLRSMYANNDSAVHQDFMKRMIAGSQEGNGAGESKPIYKMTDDARITRIGRILRRTSLDELPQFINVFKGDMSLVGPRPPLLYEYEEYDGWHRKRVLEVKPGITGLWQVNGRSRVGFDDMVRLDLQYARRWSLWFDVQILAQTPRAVVLGDGAL